MKFIEVKDTYGNLFVTFYTNVSHVSFSKDRLNAYIHFMNQESAQVTYDDGIEFVKLWREHANEGKK